MSNDTLNAMDSIPSDVAINSRSDLMRALVKYTDLSEDQLSQVCDDFSRDLTGPELVSAWLNS